VKNAPIEYILHLKGAAETDALSGGSRFAGSCEITAGGRDRRLTVSGDMRENLQLHRQMK
jgi:hypothetical protein